MIFLQIQFLDQLQMDHKAIYSSTQWISFCSEGQELLLFLIIYLQCPNISQTYPPLVQPLMQQMYQQRTATPGEEDKFLRNH